MVIGASAALIGPPVQAARPAIGLPKSGLIVLLYPPATNEPPPATTSIQVPPPSVLTSSTPPSNVFSKLKRCQKMRWLVEEMFCVGATSRSSFRSSVDASLKNERLALCAFRSVMTCQVGLAGPRLFWKVSTPQPGLAPGSNVSLKLPVGTSGQNGFTVTRTVAVALRFWPFLIV